MVRLGYHSRWPVSKDPLPAIPLPTGYWHLNEPLKSVGMILGYCFLFGLEEARMEKTRILFLCTGSSARSQMTEAYLRRYSGDRFDVYNAGLVLKGMDTFTVQVMEEISFDMSGQYAKDIDEYPGKTHFEYWITVCDNADKNCPTIWPGVNQRLHWPF